MADGYYGDQYYLLSPSWRSTIYCHFGAFLLSQSFLFQMICLAILALIRSNMITKDGRSMPLDMPRFTVLLTSLFFITSMVHICIILHGYMTTNYFMQPHDMCTMLMVTPQESLSMFIMSIISQISFSASLICMTVCYVLIWFHTRKIKKAVSEVGDLSQKDGAKGVLARLVLTVTSHSCCIVPILLIIMMKNINMVGSPSGLAYSFILFLPINSIIDPVIYTFSSSSFVEKIKNYMK